MGERKVLNKYYPPDFDGAKLPRNKRPRDQQELVRFMLPMTVRCNTCGEYMYAGKKFNVKKETVLDEVYLGRKIFRFYLKCVTCSAPFTIKTDPKNADYICETGASKNFEPWRQQEMAEDEAKAALDEAEMDAMHALENRTLDAKEEMDMLDALEEIKSLRGKHGKLDFNVLLAVQQRQFMNSQRADAVKEEAIDREQGEIARRMFEKKRLMIKRVDEDVHELNENGIEQEVGNSRGHNGKESERAADQRDSQIAALSTPSTRTKLNMGQIRLVKVAKKPAPVKTGPAIALMGLAAYSDDDDEDSDEEDEE